MNQSLNELFTSLGRNFINYMPNLLGGIILIVIGWFLAWLAKRVIIQFSIILKLERFLIGFRWGKDFAKADIRYGLYNYIGNIVFFIIFIIFFNDALNTWKLTIFSNVLERAIFYFPKIFISLIIFSIGWLISVWTSRAIQRTLRRENIPRANLISHFTKAVIVLFFSAMALVELDIAREIVVIGFSTIFITLGAFTIVITIIGGKDFTKKIGETLGEE